jgi:ribosomal protein L6P/L9E
MLNKLSLKLPNFINLTFKHESNSKIPLTMIISFGKNNIQLIDNIGLSKTVYPILKSDGFLQFVQNTDVFTNKIATFSNVYYSHIYNKLIGWTYQFLAYLQLKGIGYRVNVKNNSIVLKIGQSHLIKYYFPEAIQIKKVKKNILKLKGTDIALVNHVTNTIRSLKKLDKYRGKGIIFKNQVIKLKPGKKKK